jgi:hypothetical protein
VLKLRALNPRSLRLESVRRLQAGLHSFLSMRRIEARRARRDQRFDQSSFVVGQIARISQLAAVVTGAVLARPLGDPPRIRPPLESQVIHMIQELFGQTLRTESPAVGGKQMGCKWFQRQAGQNRPGAAAESATSSMRWRRSAGTLSSARQPNPHQRAAETRQRAISSSRPGHSGQHPWSESQMIGGLHWKACGLGRARGGLKGTISSSRRRRTGATRM